MVGFDRQQTQLGENIHLPTKRQMYVIILGESAILEPFLNHSNVLMLPSS